MCPVSMYAYVYVFMYVYIYICIYLCIHIFIYVYIHLCTYLCMYIFIYVYIYTCIYLCIDKNTKKSVACWCVFVCVCTYIHYIHTYIRAYMYMHTCIHAYLHICIYLCIDTNIAKVSQPDLHCSSWGNYILAVCVVRVVIWTTRLNRKRTPCCCEQPAWRAPSAWEILFQTQWIGSKWGSKTSKAHARAASLSMARQNLIADCSESVHKRPETTLGQIKGVRWRAWVTHNNWRRSCCLGAWGPWCKPSVTVSISRGIRSEEH